MGYESIQLAAMVYCLIRFIPVMKEQRVAYLEANGYKREKRLLFFLGWVIVVLISLRTLDLLVYAVNIPYLRAVLIVALVELLYHCYFRNPRSHT